METVTIETEPARLAGQLEVLLRSGRTGAARPVLSALGKLSPDPVRYAEYGAWLALQEGNGTAALEALNTGLAERPGHPALLRWRADIRRRAGDRINAARDAADAVIEDPGDPTGKALLGVILTEIGRPLDGIACLTEAVAANHQEPAYWEALANAQAASGNSEAAAQTLAAGISAAPGSTALRNAAALVALRRDEPEKALGIIESARRQGHADACLFGLKAHALSCLGRAEEAAEAYREALKLGPDDPYVRHLVAASGALPSGSRASTDYLRAVFDGYASRFESSLIGLGYRVPGLVRLALERHARLPAEGLLGPVLDLGCGTGLIALALYGCPVGPIHGVDVSPRMLQIAGGKRLYTTLTEADALQALASPGPDYAVIFAADVLCYFGDLGPLFAAVSERLKPSGLFICSAEDCRTEGPGRELRSHGRYAHSAGYLADAAAAAGFESLAIDQEVQRLEQGEQVPGHLAVLRRPAA